MKILEKLKTGNVWQTKKDLMDKGELLSEKVVRRELCQCLVSYNPKVSPSDRVIKKIERVVLDEDDNRFAEPKSMMVYFYALKERVEASTYKVSLYDVNGEESEKFSLHKTHSFEFHENPYRIYLNGYRIYYGVDQVYEEAFIGSPFTIRPGGGSLELDLGKLNKFKFEGDSLRIEDRNQGKIFKPIESKKTVEEIKEEIRKGHSVSTSELIASMMDVARVMNNIDQPKPKKPSFWVTFKRIIGINV